MKKQRAKKRTVIILLCIHEILMIIIGMGIAVMLENMTVTNGAALVLPMAFLLIALGWILRESFGEIKE